MAISLLKIKNFRNIADADISPASRGLNIISGLNGSGKTSLLEAIFYLGHNRSFRTSTASRVIRHQSSQFSLYSQVVGDGGINIPVGMERYTDGRYKLKLNDGDAVSASKLTQLIPIRVINSQSHSLLESGPSFRRKFIDWGLFYNEAGFVPVWKQYERGLKQRNMALKARCSRSEYDAWTYELSKSSSELTDMRKSYLNKLSEQVLAYVRQLLEIRDVKLVYSQGWDKGRQFSEVLHEHYWDEIRAGVTQFGPHRADFDILVDGVSAQHYLSRGQQKLLICAMILAQGALLASETNKALTYLIDDLPAELDDKSRNKLLSLLLQQDTQIFITSIEHETIFEAMNQENRAALNVFHVEHGKISAGLNV